MCITGEIAGKIKADRLIFLTDVDGIMQDHTNKETLISDITRKEVEILIEDGTISGGMLPKVETCLHALKKVWKM